VIDQEASLDLAEAPLPLEAGGGAAKGGWPSSSSAARTAAQ
jgi:hypothetical protein